MGNIILFMHASLDGFVCGPNGEMNWIKVDDEIFDFVEATISETDSALYGRVTWEMMESYWPTAADEPDASNHDRVHSKWYKNATKYVLSKTLKGKNFPNTKILGENLVNEINSLKETSKKNVIIFGSPTAAHALMKEDLVDEFWIFVNPIILGKGIPMFDNTQNRNTLKLTTNKAFNAGVVCLRYEKIK